MALSIDFCTFGENAFGSTTYVDLTTSGGSGSAATAANAGDILVVIVLSEQVPTNGGFNTAAITDTIGGLTWNLRERVNADFSGATIGGQPCYQTFEVWWAYAASSFSNKNITATFSGGHAVEHSSMLVYGFTGFVGTAYRTNPWDLNGLWSTTDPTTTGATSTPSQTGITTATNSGLMLGVCMFTSGGFSITQTLSGFTFDQGVYNSDVALSGFTTVALNGTYPFLADPAATLSTVLDTAFQPGINQASVQGFHQNFSSTVTSATYSFGTATGQWQVYFDALNDGSHDISAGVSAAAGAGSITPLIKFIPATSFITASPGTTSETGLTMPLGISIAAQAQIPTPKISLVPLGSTLSGAAQVIAAKIPQIITGGLVTSQAQVKAAKKPQIITGGLVTSQAQNQGPTIFEQLLASSVSTQAQALSEIIAARPAGASTTGTAQPFTQDTVDVDVLGTAGLATAGTGSGFVQIFLGGASALAAATQVFFGKSVFLGGVQLNLSAGTIIPLVTITETGAAISFTTTNISVPNRPTFVGVNLTSAAGSTTDIDTLPIFGTSGSLQAAPFTLVFVPTLGASSSLGTHALTVIVSPNPLGVMGTLGAGHAGRAPLPGVSSELDAGQINYVYKQPVIGGLISSQIGNVFGFGKANLSGGFGTSQAGIITPKVIVLPLGNAATALVGTAIDLRDIFPLGSGTGTGAGSSHGFDTVLTTLGAVSSGAASPFMFETIAPHPTTASGLSGAGSLALLEFRTTSSASISGQAGTVTFIEVSVVHPAGAAISGQAQNISMAYEHIIGSGMSVAPGSVIANPRNLILGVSANGQAELILYVNERPLGVEVTGHAGTPSFVISTKIKSIRFDITVPFAVVNRYSGTGKG